MIEDDAGLWVVQPGSMLPDSSRVAAIEQRDGKWVLVTTDRPRHRGLQVGRFAHDRAAPRKARARLTA